MVNVRSRFKNLVTPSRHSGLSSLSPKEPNNSLTNTSTFSGISIERISPNKSCISWSFHSLFCLCWSLSKVVNESGQASRFICPTSRMRLDFSLSQIPLLFVLHEQEHRSNGPREGHGLHQQCIPLYGKESMKTSCPGEHSSQLVTFRAIREGSNHSFFVEHVLDRVLLESLVSHTRKIVHQRL